MKISRWILVRVRNAWNKCRENQNTHFLFSNFFPENRAVYEIMWKNVVEPERPQTTMWRRVACWISKAKRSHAHARARASTHTQTHTLSLSHTQTHKYIIIIAFPLQQLFRERASMLRYTHIACLFFRIYGQINIDFNIKLRSGLHNIGVPTAAVSISKMFCTMNVIRRQCGYSCSSLLVICRKFSYFSPG
jgi:hypothetical protein